MTKITWNETGSRVFEAGFDRGVLYIPGGIGVPWNGFISVDENPGSTIQPVYFDGRKINDIVDPGVYSARLRAYTYPEEFEQFQGNLEDSSGLLLTNQPQERFHLSYRTKIGNDVDSEDHGYRIHILYNLTAIPSTRSYKTLGLEVEPSEFEWTLSSIPSDIAGFRPTSHIILDSRKIPYWFLADVEEVLYGSDTRDPGIPELEGFATFFRKYNRIVIFDNGDGSWTAATDRIDAITYPAAGDFQIDGAEATYLDADTYDLSSTPNQDEDLWQP